MNDLKRGDKIKRINDQHGVCKVGEIYTFDYYINQNAGNFKIKEDKSEQITYSPKNFILVSKAKKRGKAPAWL